MLHVERLSEWELDYLLNLLDDDGNRRIDKEEFTSNYLFITEQLMRNKPLEKVLPPNLFAEIIKCSEVKNESYFIESLLMDYNELKQKKNALKKTEEEDQTEKNDDPLDGNVKLTKEIIPLTSLIAKEVIQINQKNLCDNCRKMEKRKSMLLDPTPVDKS